MKNLINVLDKGNGLYDCILMLSGGKDSVLALHNILSSKPLNILTITYDDRYLSEMAKRNVQNVCKHFGVDNLMLQYDMRKCINSFTADDLAKTVDLNTFTEVFQNIFWKKIGIIAERFDSIPVVTGNIGYFSSEEFLPEQHKAAKRFIQDYGIAIPETDCVFISYWAEETYNKNFDALKTLKWESNSGLSTEDHNIKNLRECLNRQWPKETLDDFVEANWEELTKPRFC